MPITITREEFHQIYVQGEDAVYALVQMLVQRYNKLEERVTVLEARLGKDSHNSSKPPSSDWNRKTPQSLREKTGKRGTLHTAPFPRGVDAPVQYGPSIRSILVYFSQYPLLPQKRLTDAMTDLFDVRISEGTVNKAIQETYVRLEATESAIKDAILGSPVVHGDETGMYVAGKRIWQHTLGTSLHTYFFCHGNRGKAALREDGTLEGLNVTSECPKLSKKYPAVSEACSAHRHSVAFGDTYRLFVNMV
ncbi:MAG: hypothetical protein A2293_04340 [Elusimicrobia bacterium RIFOXYB2_FULL_49_7]|nr:MAG: hypothetical protein A2293_04340 [Elusimicrobia bacterium RIFOXYB2_FULL_49_7]